jgi:hypothetical protein
MEEAKLLMSNEDKAEEDLYQFHIEDSLGNGSFSRLISNHSLWEALKGNEENGNIDVPLDDSLVGDMDMWEASPEHLVEPPHP